MGVSFLLKSKIKIYLRGNAQLIFCCVLVFQTQGLWCKVIYKMKPIPLKRVIRAEGFKANAPSSGQISS